MSCAADSIITYAKLLQSPRILFNNYILLNFSVLTYKN